ncbi:MAG: hypothetical protein ACO3AF_09865 [Flavobacteriales bacterium]|jgi:hypothetical protein
MDDLIDIIHQLSEDELTKLKRELRADKQKIKLLEYCLETQQVNNEEIIDLLNYKNNKSAYYTFKHRLLQDIIAFKFSSGQTKITRIKQDIANLRTLLFSNQPRLLEKKLNDLLKRAREAELFHEAHEALLCQYALFNDDTKRRHAIEAELPELSQKTVYFQRLELLFFKALSLGHDQFYSECPEVQAELKQTVVEIKKLHLKLDARVSQFLAESTELTLLINSNQSISPAVLQRLSDLLKLYIETPLEFAYPNSHLGIKCLFNKAYFKLGMVDEHRQTLSDIGQSIEQIKGLRTYEDVYFYYLYATSIELLESQKHSELMDWLNAEISDTYLTGVSGKMSFYLLFLKGMANFYGKSYGKAYSYLLTARNFTKHLDSGSAWILPLNSVFALLTLACDNGHALMDSEKKYLKRQIPKTAIQVDRIQAFLDVLPAFNKGRKQAKAEIALQGFHIKGRETGEFALLRLADLYAKLPDQLT